MAREQSPRSCIGKVGYRTIDNMIQFFNFYVDQEVPPDGVLHSPFNFLPICVCVFYALYLLLIVQKCIFVGVWIL